MISIGDWFTEPNYAKNRVHIESGTYMHELGHSLGLGHGGPMPDGRISSHPSTHERYENYKPNYLSVMNYSFQYDFSHIARPLDYSSLDENTLHTLNEEGKLDEKQGIVVGKPIPSILEDKWKKTVFSYDPGSGGKVIQKYAGTTGAIDWSGDEKPVDVKVRADINAEPQKPPQNEYSVLSSHEDWNDLRYNFRASEDFFVGGTTPPAALAKLSMTKEEADAAGTSLDYDEDGLSNIEDNAPHVYNPDQTDTDGDGIGDASELLGFTLNEVVIAGNRSTTATIELLLPAPDEGAVVELFLSDPWFVNLPGASPSRQERRRRNSESTPFGRAPQTNR